MSQRNPRFALLLIFPAILSAQRIPGRYIVELDTEPVAEHVARLRSRQGVRGSEAAAHRARIATEHDTVRTRLEQKQATVLDSVDTVANALIVDATDPAQLASTPGVKRVYAVRLFHPVLDRAVQLHKVVDAWNQIGGSDQAGAGIKIAIVDTGVDVSHAGFQDSSLTAPDGFPRFNQAADRAYTSGKIIVARSYVSLLPFRDPDSSARDHVGHGTALAMVAAGVRNAVRSRPSPALRRRHSSATTKCSVRRGTTTARRTRRS